MKKVCAILLSLTLLLGLLPAQVNAVRNTVSGSCGENVTWSYNRDTEHLIISGTGPMYDYSPEKAAPWSQFSHFNIITVAQGVTRIGDYSFTSLTRGYKFSIAASVAEVGACAFGDLRPYVMFWGDMPRFAPDAFADSLMNIYHLRPWDEADLPDCQSDTLSCEQVSLFMGDDPRQIYQLGEEFDPQDLGMYTKCSIHKFPYMPIEYTVEGWDTQTLGEKTATVTMDGVTYSHTYLVTDGQSHLDMVEVAGLPLFVEYDDSNQRSHEPKPVVTAGSLVLKQDIHYMLSYENANAGEANVRLTIDGLGQWKGLRITHYYGILKKDISGQTVSAEDQLYAGTHLYPELPGTYWEDYVTLEKDNINIGTATFWKVGLGKYYGATQGTFQITDAAGWVLPLEGNYMGKYDQQPTGEPKYMEVVFPPGPFYGELDLDVPHTGYYELYRIEGEEPVLVTTLETGWGIYEETAFRYDFSHHYEPESGTALEIYLLGYSWVDEYGRLYSGVCTLYIPAKVPPATEILVQQLEDSGDFRKLYLDAYGNGTLDGLTWSSSDPSVATVDEGIVTLLTPGVTQIAARCGELEAVAELTVTPYSLEDCDFHGYDPETGKPALSLNGVPLIPGTDYDVEYVPEAGGKYIVISGKNLFDGSIRFLMDLAGEQHTHRFDDCLDGFCEVCSLRRQPVHTYSAMKYDENIHWYDCTVCGIRLFEDEHSPNSQYGCSTCELPAIWPTGDINHDGKLNNRDATRLLQYLAGWEVEADARYLDVNRDGEVNNRDVTRLLQYLADWEVFIY